jgi:hypothetical protein
VAVAVVAVVAVAPLHLFQFLYSLHHQDKHQQLYRQQHPTYRLQLEWVRQALLFQKAATEEKVVGDHVLDAINALIAVKRVAHRYTNIDTNILELFILIY